MKIRCECGAVYNVPEATGGKNVRCKQCDTMFVCPTPPPRPTSSGKKVPGTFARSAGAKSKSSQRTSAEEDAILRKFMSEESSLEDRMRDRRLNSIEEDRTSNSIRFIVVGCLWLVAAVIVGVALFKIGSFTRIPLILAFVYGLGGQYWLPPLMGVFGVYKFIIGVMSFTRVLDIESQEQLPTRW
ncbi:hypothetical protein [Mariniblastus fucicola]|uniref:Uncharacterized protein n=1 Tax=Mariniblastus fucicola TaxID=980251 RepID=A0A5B9PKW5_9BACT|nr:hypothetical protein [Mariniblastus fucicola]QEG23311.1 hypothetical protein MFFC18_32070 [Mariniblastus fucicola]